MMRKTRKPRPNAVFYKQTHTQINYVYFTRLENRYRRAWPSLHQAQAQLF